MAYLANFQHWRALYGLQALLRPIDLSIPALFKSFACLLPYLPTSSRISPLCIQIGGSELTYYPVQEPGTRLLEPGYPDSFVRVRVRHKPFG